jgi:hypothetical protein
MSLAELVKKFGGRFSRELGIELSMLKTGEVFKWLLASVLFGARILQAVAKRTFEEFEKAKVTSPRDIIKTGWDGVVEILDRGGYVRYDFKTATKLLDMSSSLLDHYGGDLNALHLASADGKELETRIKSLSKGIGNVTANIFLRELRGLWQKADPLPQELVISAAKDLGIIPASLKDRRKILELLLDLWRKEKKSTVDFADFESALLRAGLVLRRRKAKGGRADIAKNS